MSDKIIRWLMWTVIGLVVVLVFVTWLKGIMNIALPATGIVGIVPLGVVRGET